MSLQFRKATIINSVSLFYSLKLEQFKRERVWLEPREFSRLLSYEYFSADRCLHQCEEYIVADLPDIFKNFLWKLF